jgi:hypothetical protein
MSRPSNPFITPRRRDTKTFQITINCSSGLPWKVCQEWRRRSFQDLPNALAQYRNPKTKAAAEAGALALIEYLKKGIEEGAIQQVFGENITVGDWAKKFIDIETSPGPAGTLRETGPIPQEPWTPTKTTIITIL